MNVTLLRTSFEALRPQAPLLVERFYAILFERYPRVKPMFAHVDLAHQKQKLIQALALLVANLEQADVLKNYLGELGSKHVRYGVKTEHYAAVGECLLAAMAEVAGPRWNDELQREWAATYNVVATLMQQRSAEPAGVA
jgi:hemoglobin-like flavoprotein